MEIEKQNNLMHVLSSSECRQENINTQKAKEIDIDVALILYKKKNSTLNEKKKKFLHKWEGKAH